MLPSPASSNPIKRHESPHYLQKMDTLVSIPLEFSEGGTRARGSKNEVFSNAQREEEVRSFQECSPPIGYASSDFREVENAESEEDLYHPPDSTWNLAQSVVSTRLKVELAPGRSFSALQHTTSFPSTFQLNPCSTYQETMNDGNIDFGHPVEVEQGTQDFAEGEILEMPKPLGNRYGGSLDSMVVNTNWCDLNRRVNKQDITVNDSSTPDGPTLLGETCRQQVQQHMEDQISYHQRKRKTVKYDHRLKKEQHRDGKKRAAIQPPAISQGLNSPSSFTVLGSLPAFMATRDIAPKRRVNAERPFFATKNQQPIDDRTERQNPAVVSNQYAEPVIQCEEHFSILSNASASQHVPQ